MHLEQGNHVASLEGIDLAYTVTGNGPLLFAVSSGWGVGSGYLVKGLAALADHFTLVCITTRGSGRSSRPTDEKQMATSHMADDVERLRRYLGLESIDLFGHSNGGAIALGFAATYPSACRKLILADSQLLGAFAPEATAAILHKRADDPRFADAIAALKGSGPLVFEDEKITQALMSTFPLYFHDPDANMQKAADTFDFPVESWATRTHMTADADPEEAQLDLLPHIQAQTLVLVGRDDFQTPVEISQKIASGIPNAKLEIIEDCGHMPWIEQPRQFFEKVLEFVASA